MTFLPAFTPQVKLASFEPPRDRSEYQHLTECFESDPGSRYTWAIGVAARFRPLRNEGLTSAKSRRCRYTASKARQRDRVNRSVMRS